MLPPPARAQRGRAQPGMAAGSRPATAPRWAPGSARPAAPSRRRHRHRSACFRAEQSGAGDPPAAPQGSGAVGRRWGAAATREGQPRQRRGGRPPRSPRAPRTKVSAGGGRAAAAERGPHGAAEGAGDPGGTAISPPAGRGQLLPRRAPCRPRLLPSSTEQSLRRAIVSRRAAAATPRRRSPVLHGRGRERRRPPARALWPAATARPAPARPRPCPAPPCGARSAASAARARSLRRRRAQSHLVRGAAGSVGAGLPRRGEAGAGGLPVRRPERSPAAPSPTEAAAGK